MPRNEDRLDITALMDSLSCLPSAPVSFAESLQQAIRILCDSSRVVAGRAQLQGAFAGERQPPRTPAWHSTLPDSRFAPLEKAIREQKVLPCGSDPDSRLRVRRLEGTPSDDVEAAAREAGLSCVLYLDVTAKGLPAATIQLFTDRAVDPGDPLLPALRLVGRQLDGIAAGARFRSAIARAAAHGRRQHEELEAARERIAEKDARLLRLEREIAEMEAEADLRAYRSRKPKGSGQRRSAPSAPGPTAPPAGGSGSAEFELLDGGIDPEAGSKPLQTASLYDRRTELPRREILQDRIDQAIRRRQRSPKNLFAVLAVSADGLERVAVESGTEGLDVITTALSRRILAQVRNADTVAHYDDATFVVVLEDIRILDEAVRIAERLVREMQRPIWSGSKETQLAVRIGIVFGGPSYDRSPGVLRDARSALHRSRAGGTSVAVFDEATQHEEEIRRRVEVELGAALGSDQLYLEYQPIVSLQDGRIDGIEAFLRWRHPEHGLIPPDQFIPIAAQSPLIHDLGVWLLERSCEQVRTWQKSLSRPVPTIDLNVTARQLLHERTAGRVRDIVARHGLRCEQFRFDIPESDLMRNPDASAAALMELRKLGCRIAIDDFGTGFSSLRLLHSMQIDAVKIDRSFISGSKGNERLAVARTIVQLARSLDADVIAEGVETHDQFRFLRSVGCGSAQGYLFSAPVSGGKIIELIRDGYPLDKPAAR